MITRCKEYGMTRLMAQTNRQVRPRGGTVGLFFRAQRKRAR